MTLKVKEKKLKTKLTVSLSNNDNIIWRWTEEISDKAMVRLSVEEYSAVVRAAERELANQIKLFKGGRKSVGHKQTKVAE